MQSLRALAPPAAAPRRSLHTRPAPRCSSGARRMQTTSALTIYTNPNSRSQIIEWYAKEIGITYNVVNLDMAQGDHKKAEYLELHPFGKVPAVKCEDGTSIFESGAILMYLADKNGALTTAEQRGAAAAWVLWANATFAPAVFSGGPSRGTALKNMCVPLNARLAKTPFLLGDAFTVADVAVGAYLAYTTMFFPDTKATFKAFPAISKYMEGIEKRPAFAATIGSE